eukprot:4815496-Amphidinium_carterae.4
MGDVFDLIWRLLSGNICLRWCAGARTNGCSQGIAKPRMRLHHCMNMFGGCSAIDLQRRKIRGHLRPILSIWQVH